MNKINMKKIALAFALFFAWARSEAQLPQGSIAPDFTVTDLSGQQHHLYSLLNSGKTVFIDFFATWCGICWNYHNSNALKTIWNTYGPPGSNQAFVIAIEGDGSTSVPCITGSSGCTGGTIGNWTSGVPYPTCDNASVASLYQVNGFPTIYCICPDSKKAYRPGTLNATALWNYRNTNCTNAAPLATVNAITHVNCFGQNTGAVDISVSGGTPPLTYNWSNGQTSQDLSNVLAGNYSCTITASGGASTTLGPIAVTQPAAILSASVATASPIRCDGPGSITAQAIGGTPGYFFQWGAQAGATIEVMQPGTYIVTVADSRGCTATASQNMPTPAPPTASIAAPATITCAQPQIALNANASSQGASIQYNWQVSSGGHIVSGATTATPNVNAAGMYQLTVLNLANGCTASASTTVSAMIDPPTASIAAPNILNCQNSQSTLNGSASSAGANFSYQWSSANGQIASGGNSPVAIAATAGAYNLVVSNTSNGCTASAQVQVLQRPPLVASIAGQTNNLCFGQNIGSATVAASGGSGVYNFHWSNGGTTASIANLPGGQYAVTTTDSDNCSASAQVSIVQPAQLICNANATAPTALGTPTGTASANPSGGSGNYSYLWTTGATTPQILNLQPGNYAVTVTDQNACTASQTVVVNAFNCVLQSSLGAVTPTRCFGTATGGATVASVNAVPPLQYQWSNGQTTSAGILSDVLPSGQQSVTVMDASGCQSVVVFNVPEAEALSINSVGMNNPTCPGGTNGSVSVAGQGGTGPYSFIWSNGQTGAVLSNVPSGNYQVTLQDARACTTSKNFALTSPIPLTISALGQTNNVCIGEANGTATVFAQGGTGQLNYAWSNGQIGPTASGLAPGIFAVTASDQNGCQSPSLQFSITANDAEPPSISVQNALLMLPPAGQQTLTLNDLNGTISDNCDSVRVFLLPDQFSCANLGPNTVTVMAIDRAGNIATRNVTVEVLENVPPTVNCPANIRRCFSENVVQFSVSGQDNCISAVVVAQTSGLPSGSAFPPGKTTQIFTLTDAAGNVSNCVFDIEIGQRSQATGFETQGCFENCFGIISIGNVVGGPSPHSILWSNGQSGPVASNLCSGEILIELTDAEGCKTVQSQTIQIPAPLDIVNVDITDDTNGQSTGSVALEVSGGLAPYIYVWTDAASQIVGTDSILLAVPAGAYTLRVSDAQGCLLISEVFVVENTVSAVEPDWARSILLLPNPAQAQAILHFQRPIPGEIRVVLRDSKGRALLEKQGFGDSDLEIGLSDFAAGVYWVQVFSGEGFATRLLILQTPE